MRTGTRKNTHVQVHHAKKTIVNSRRGKLSTKTIRSIKAHPYLSLGTAAMALSALSGLITWFRVKKNHQVKHFLFIGKK